MLISNEDIPIDFIPLELQVRLLQVVHKAICASSLQGMLNATVLGLKKLSGYEVVGIEVFAHSSTLALRNYHAFIGADAVMENNIKQQYAEVEPEEAMPTGTRNPQARLARCREFLTSEMNFEYCWCGIVEHAGKPLGLLWAASKKTPPDPDQPPLVLQASVAIFGCPLKHGIDYEIAHGIKTQYERFSANLTDALWTTYLTPRPHMVFVSDGFEKLTERPRRFIMEEPARWREIIHPDDWWIFSRDLERVREATIQHIDHRVRVNLEDGTTRWVQNRGRAVRDSVGLRLDVISQDVTDWVHLEEQVRRADRLAAVGTMAAGIAHEFNNIHFAVLGALELLLMREDIPPELLPHIKRAREATTRASEITNKIASFARGGGSERAEFNLNEMILTTIDIVRSEFETKGTVFQLDCTPGPQAVYGNANELSHVLMNLLINAQQAMEDSTTKTLKISTREENDKVLLSVSDTGHGIAADHMHRLFDPFFTTKGAAGSGIFDRTVTDSHMAGTGLGLSVSETIVREHGGLLEVESEPGRGTTFRVILPRLSRLREVIPAGSEPVETLDTSILVIDDDPNIRNLCGELLQKLGYQVSMAGDGEKALELAETGKFDVLLVDLQMPDIDGLDLIRYIRRLPDKPIPAIVILTGKPWEISDAVKAEHGINTVLGKPAGAAELLAAIENARANADSNDE